jgi:hypothetical protein
VPHHPEIAQARLSAAGQQRARGHHPLQFDGAPVLTGMPA